MRSFFDLTERFPVSIDVSRLRDELGQMENLDWSRHYDMTQPSGWTTILLRSINGSIDGPESMRHGRFDEYKNTPLLERFPHMREVVDAFQCPIGRVRLSKMAPHMAINAHRDIGEEVASIAFGQVRLHIPITTNDKVFFYVGKEKLQMAPGRLYYVDFAKVHSVRNDGDESRVHLFLELKVNDWLNALFPKFTPIEQVDMALQRIYLPVFWKLHKLWMYDRRVHKLRKMYEASVLQVLWRWIRDRTGLRNPVGPS
jgi:hypothetical protein